jgi:hypothetical protein
VPKQKPQRVFFGGHKKINFYQLIKKAHVRKFLHDFYTCEDGNHALCRIAPAAAGQPVNVTLRTEHHHWPADRVAKAHQPTGE